MEEQSREDAGPAQRAVDSGLSALVMLAQYHGVPANPEQLRHEFAPDGGAFDVDRILQGARHLGLKARRVRTKLSRLEHTPLPAVGATRDGRFFVLGRVSEKGALLQFPGERSVRRLSWEGLENLWSGELILFTSRASLTAELGKFDFSWFVPALVKHRKLLGEVLVASFFIQLFALLTPLFFQVVMDKVLVHRSLTTLDVLAIGLTAVMVFEVLLSGLRSYVLAHTASRIDVELGARLFRHLINLPMGYFESRRVGDSVARVRELENIRGFLTGNALTLVLDLFFSVVFIAVMLFYSGWLTLIVLASLPVYMLISLFITPPLRARLHEKFNRGAENQAFLVESINGIDTLKSMAVEPQTTKKWDEQLAGYVSAGLKTTRLSTTARELISLVGKLVTVGTLWLGARLVIEGDLTVGQLIAFNMLAARVAQPIMAGEGSARSDTALRALSRADARRSSAAEESFSFQGRQRSRCPAQGAPCGAWRVARARRCDVLTWPPARRRHRALITNDSPSQSGIGSCRSFPWRIFGRTSSRWAFPCSVWATSSTPPPSRRSPIAAVCPGWRVGSSSIRCISVIAPMARRSCAG
jgi:subfamily B ATP-binding cassette protein HlyB/CyaB